MKRSSTQLELEKRVAREGLPKPYEVRGTEYGIDNPCLTDRGGQVVLSTLAQGGAMSTCSPWWRQQFSDHDWSSCSRRGVMIRPATTGKSTDDSLFGG